MKKVKRRFWGMMWCVVLMVQSLCIWTKPDVTHYDLFCLDVFKPSLMWLIVIWFYSNVFGPNLLWSVVIGSILMCVDLTRCHPLCLGFVLMCYDQTWCDPLCWCDLIVVRNLRDSRKLRNSKMNSIIEERDWRLRRKSRISKV